MISSDRFSINPIHFFTVSSECNPIRKKEDVPPHKSHRLPLTTQLTRDPSFAEVAVGWHEEGLAFNIDVNETPLESCFPDVDLGDAVELFIDTRDLKTSGFNTRFCHHFFFLPQLVDGVNKGEKTHFRTEDSHPLCDPQLLHCEVKSKKGGYQMQIFVPTECLFGYDPKQFDRVGFTYRISTRGKKRQHFSAVSSDYQIDQQPSLWGSLKLLTS